MNELFDTALMMLDDESHPVLLIPTTMPDGDAFIRIVDSGIDIGVNGTVYGALRDMEDEELALLVLAQKVPLSTFDVDKDETLPDTIDHLATVTDTRQ